MDRRRGWFHVMALVGVGLEQGCKQMKQVSLPHVLKGHIMVFTVTWAAKANDNNNRGSLDFETEQEAMDFVVLFNAQYAKVEITWQQAG